MQRAKIRTNKQTHPCARRSIFGANKTNIKDANIGNVVKNMGNKKGKIRTIKQSHVPVVEIRSKEVDRRYKAKVNN